MAAEINTECDERFRYLFATVAKESFYRKHGRIKWWLRMGAKGVEHSYAFVWNLINNRVIQPLHHHCVPYWRYYYPWTPNNRKLRKARQANRLLRKLCYKPTAPCDKFLYLVYAPMILLRRIMERDESEMRNNLKKSIFVKLPPEIRRKILIEAFGNQIIHMDLSLRHPFHEIGDEEYQVKKSLNISFAHAKICRESLSTFSVYNTSQDKRWAWFSCVCHRYWPEASRLRYGRRVYTPFMRREPEDDQCLAGRGACAEWPGEWPHKCFIGIYGWLLSCRQAYLEGQEILYRLNTIHISSPSLIYGIHDIMSPNILSMITSIDIVFDTCEMVINKAFTGLPARFGVKSSSRNERVIFPSLRQLRISFRARWVGHDPWTGERDPPRTAAPILDEASSFGNLLAIDSMLHRIAPTTAEIIVSCPTLDRYCQIENKLLATQGAQKTQSQQSDLGGLKCWRETPRKVPQQSTHNIMEDLTVEPLRAGYWIHTWQTTQAH